jgi:hypothetical protein
MGRDINATALIFWASLVSCLRRDPSCMFVGRCEI